jgi:DNA-binding transcriptional ArsR family regulator
MVQHQTLDRVFAALADPTRRGVLAQLSRGPASVGELAGPVGITLTGTKKHIQALEDAGLVTTEKVGRIRQCRLGQERLDDAMAWISFQRPPRVTKSIGNDPGGAMQMTTRVEITFEDADGGTLMTVLVGLSVPSALRASRAQRRAQPAQR